MKEHAWRLHNFVVDQKGTFASDILSLYIADHPDNTAL